MLEKLSDLRENLGTPTATRNYEFDAIRFKNDGR